jgi:hypothetical protein
LSHATVNPVRNLLGLPGAITADLMMQLFGLASTVLVLQKDETKAQPLKLALESDGTSWWWNSVPGVRK